VGKKRQQGGKRGDIRYWYPLTRPIKKILGNFRIAVSDFMNSYAFSGPRKPPIHLSHEGRKEKNPDEQQRLYPYPRDNIFDQAEKIL
jgi:hypothetical protein